MVVMINWKNYKCEDCGGDKFTMLDKFSLGVDEITLNCAGKNCESSYTFRPTMKFSSSCHPAKPCPSCKKEFVGIDTKFCSYCGKKNPRYKDKGMRRLEIDGWKKKKKK